VFVGVYVCVVRLSVYRFMSFCGVYLSIYRSECSCGVFDCSEVYVLVLCI
jgi:hypothetical protein